MFPVFKFSQRRILLFSFLLLLTSCNQAQTEADRLLSAVSLKDFRTIESLLKQGVDPNAQNEVGLTALMISAHKGHPGIVNYLLEHGADPNIQTYSGSTALMMASRKGHVEAVSLLLAFGGDPRLKNKSGNTALDEAKSRNYSAIVEMLEIIK